MPAALAFDGRTVLAGARTVVRVPVTTRLDGSELAITVHAVRGRQDGPVVTLVSALHGSEWLSIEIVRRVVETLDPARLRGSVLAIPVANPIALEQFTRMTPDESDEPDLNRVWPGGQTWITEQMAGALSREVLPQTTHLVDFHTGPWGANLATIGYARDLPDPEVTRQSLEMAVAFGYPSIRALNMMSVFPGPRSIGGYAGSALGIPNIAPNLGGVGFAPEVEEGWIDGSAQGVFNILRHLGMLDGEVALPPRFLHFESRGFRVVPRRGGLLLPHFGPADLLRDVRRGERLGTVISPYTFEVLEELDAPADGILFGSARSYPVRPGDWSYFVADAAHPATRWVDARGSVAEVARALAAGPAHS